MAYEKNTWQTGDIITQEKLNHIEEGIEAAHGDISDINGNISDINGDILQINNDVDELEEIVSGLGESPLIITLQTTFDYSDSSGFYRATVNSKQNAPLYAELVTMIESGRIVFVHEIRTITKNNTNYGTFHYLYTMSRLDVRTTGNKYVSFSYTGPYDYIPNAVEPEWVKNTLLKQWVVDNQEAYGYWQIREYMSDGELVTQLQ